jgi:TetR/AcrR family transcriptional regulator
LVYAQKKRDPESARARLLEVAIALFAEKGYASTSVREIVALAGVTKPVLYYYFKSKEGIFRAILDSAAAQQEGILAEVLEAPGTALERIIYLYRRIYEGVVENQNLFKMIHNLIFGPPQGTPEYDFEQYQRGMADTIKIIYREGLAKHEVDEADQEEVALLVLGLTEFCFHTYYLYPGSLDPGTPERLIRLAFKGLARSGASTRRKHK